MTLHVPENAKAPHYCMPPEILTWGEPDPPEHEYDLRPPKLIDQLPEGTRFHCPCGEVYYVVWTPGGRGGSVAWTGRWEWKSETNVQRLLRWIREGRS